MTIRYVAAARAFVIFSIAMQSDPRHELWTEAFNTFYDAYWGELLASALVQKWQRFDDLTRVLVAITASGSAIAGWALWSQPGPRLVWVAIAGVAAVLSIVHATLTVPDRLKRLVATEKRYSALRSDLETFRSEMRFESDFDLKVFRKRFIEYRKRLSDCAQLAEHDILSTERLRLKVQDELDRLVAAEVFPREEASSAVQKDRRASKAASDT